ncbi:hypothetical protein Rctr197k_073 [Virus Rctr197k]|nr:hypothetical protein Rctr197k_073 [Virus Rctr197k]
MTTEGQLRNFYPALRVFIFGQEVTDDVLSVSVTLNDSRSPSTAEVVLANKGKSASGVEVEDRYVITEADIMAMAKSVAVDVKLPDVSPILADFSERIEASLASIARADSSASQQLAIQEGSSLREQQLAYIRSLKDGVVTDTIFDDVRRKVRERVARDVIDPVKAQILATKVGETVTLNDTNAVKGGPGTELQATLSTFAALRGEGLRYPMQVGESIFHSNDPVRIFFRDPRRPLDWYYMFAGFYTDSVDDIDEHNQKTVTIRCEDVLRRFRYARITTSPGLIDINAAATQVDLVVRTFFNDDFSNLTLAEFLTTMVFGFTGAGTLDRANETGNVVDASTDSLSGTTTIKLINARGETTQATLPKDGAGLWSVDRSILFSLASSATESTSTDFGSTAVFTTQVADLAVYQAVIDHQVRVTDLSSMALKANGVDPISPNSLQKDPVTGEVRIDEVIKAIGEHPEIYPVDGGRFIMLAPSTLGVGYNLGVLMKGFKGPELKTTWKTRLSKIYDVLERIEFSFYATPRGDVIAEMPLHDFDPDAFGEDAVTYRQLREVLGDARAKTVFDDGHSAGPFAPSYRISRRDTIKYQRTFSDERVRTLALCSWLNIPLLPEAQSQEAAGQQPAHRLLSSLVPQFGVRAEIAESTVSSFISDQRAAEIYCQFLLNRHNGDARIASIGALPLLRLGPNRPVAFAERSFVATLREVTHQITWGERGDMSMGLKLNYIRGWDGSVDANGKPLFSYLGGYAANPLNYALLLRSQQPTASTAVLAAPNIGQSDGES